MVETNPKSNWIAKLFRMGRTSGRAGFSVAFKIIIGIIVILVLLASVQIIYSYRATSQNLQQEAEQSLLGYYQTYTTTIQTEKHNAEALAISIADRKDVQALYLSRDRDGLYELLSPMFEQWKERQIVHLYIENLDGTVFLRVHNRANFGDDITYRATALDALTEQRVTSGVEIGPNRLGVRAVAPVYSEVGKVIAMVEVGLDFDEPFIVALNENTGADFTMWVSYASAEIPNLKPVEGSPSAPIDELFYYTSTDPTLPLADAAVYRSVFETGEPEFLIVSNDNSIPTIVYVTRLLGYNDKVLGLIQVSQPYIENIESQNQAFLVSMALVGGLTIFGMLIIWLIISRLVLQPLTKLTNFAEKQTAGEVNARVTLRSGDEFEQLAKTFNILADSVEHERRTLEQRVADRTKDLSTVAQVGTVTSTILESHRLLQEVVGLTKERFNLYHSHIYLLDEAGKNLVLAAGAGEPGRQMMAKGLSIPLDREQSLVARAARERQGVTVNDVTEASDFLPNPLLPNTRSELAVPMIVGGRVIGVFDIQSEQVGRFTKADVDIQTTLAAQLAASIQNVRVLEQARQQAELQSLVNAIGSRIQLTTSNEDTLQTAIRELSKALGAARVSANIAGRQSEPAGKESVA